MMPVMESITLPVGPCAFGIRSIGSVTSSAATSAPLWTFTPGRTLNSQVLSSISFQDVASDGVGSSVLSRGTRVPQILRRTETVLPVDPTCGSSVSVPDLRPIESVWALTVVVRDAASRPKARTYAFREDG